MNAADVEKYLRGLQAKICASLESADGVAKFKSDPWTRGDASSGSSLTGGVRPTSSYRTAGLLPSSQTRSRASALSRSLSAGVVGEVEGPAAAAAVEGAGDVELGGAGEARDADAPESPDFFPPAVPFAPLPCAAAL